MGENVVIFNQLRERRYKKIYTNKDYYVKERMVPPLNITLIISLKCPASA